MNSVFKPHGPEAAGPWVTPSPPTAGATPGSDEESVPASEQQPTYLRLRVLSKHLQALVRASRSNCKKSQRQGHEWDIDGCTDLAAIVFLTEVGNGVITTEFTIHGCTFNRNLTFITHIPSGSPQNYISTGARGTSFSPSTSINDLYL